MDGLHSIWGAAAGQAIAACGGDAREAVKALIVANNFLEARVAKQQASVSTGYARGRLEPRQPEEYRPFVAN